MRFLGCINSGFKKYNIDVSNEKKRFMNDIDLLGDTKIFHAIGIASKRFGVVAGINEINY